MNARERLIATCKFAPLDRPFRFETIGFWPETITRWYDEGLPEWAEELTALVHFGMDLRMLINVGNFENPCLYPLFEEETIEETDEYRTRRTSVGNVIKEFKGGQSSIPQFLEFPVKDMQTFEDIKWRLDPSAAGRLGDDWEQSSYIYTESELPVFMYTCGLFGMARHLLGFENLMLAYYDMPDLIHAIGEQWTALNTAMLEKICASATIDAIDFWEDMAYRNGPIIGPEAFKEFMLPYYKRVIDCARSLGVEILAVDSDGYIDPLIPLFIESGVNVMYPFEVQAGMDVREVRKRYGRQLVIQGGLDKRALAIDFAAIKEEVESKVPQLLGQGGYIPSLDHNVPPDVPLENFEYYLELVRGIGENNG
jgi:uroporphyrinogen decarboxylase